MHSSDLPFFANNIVRAPLGVFEVLVESYIRTTNVSNVLKQSSRFELFGKDVKVINEESNNGKFIQVFHAFFTFPTEKRYLVTSSECIK